MRSVVRATLVATVAGLAGGPAIAAPTLFGTAEYQSEALRELPQWQDVLARMQAEASLTAACRAAPERCPSRAARAWSRLLHSLDGAPTAVQLSQNSETKRRKGVSTGAAAFASRAGSAVAASAGGVMAQVPCCASRTRGSSAE